MQHLSKKPLFLFAEVDEEYGHGQSHRVGDSSSSSGYGSGSYGGSSSSTDGWNLTLEELGILNKLGRLSTSMLWSKVTTLLASTTSGCTCLLIKVQGSWLSATSPTSGAWAWKRPSHSHCAQKRACDPPATRVKLTDTTIMIIWHFGILHKTTSNMGATSRN